MLTESYSFTELRAICLIIFELIKILVFFPPDDTLEEIYETGPGDVVHLLTLIQENGMSETVGMKDLLREYLTIVVEVIDSEPAQVA